MIFAQNALGHFANQDQVIESDKQESSNCDVFSKGTTASQHFFPNDAVLLSQIPGFRNQTHLPGPGFLLCTKDENFARDMLVFKKNRMNIWCEIDGISDIAMFKLLTEM